MPTLFSHKFLISKIMDSNDVDEEIAREFGFRSRFVFLIRVNDKDEAHRMGEVVSVLRRALGPQNVLVLFENETEVGPEDRPS